ncbi:MAG TPA: GNAT family N-acetyltransferase [Fibrobacteria bacterium]|nr:GNAT family N-acetyltransferase [Fibrobacteria bacterium]
MNPTLKIRPATESDIDAILSLQAQLGQDDGVALTTDQALAVLRRMAAYPDYGVRVAELDDGVVGCYALLVMDNLAHLGAPSAIVEDVVVDASCRGQGIGRAMMHDAMCVAREKGCYKLVLNSNLRRLDAHRFYEGLGFERHGVSFQVPREGFHA